MLHHLIIGTWTPPGNIYTVAFDDETLSLTLLKKTAISHHEPISWMTFDHAKKNIYGASMKSFSSYNVANSTDIIHHASHPIGGDRACHPHSAQSYALVSPPSSLRLESG
ncbi:MAG: carboxy-cis [Lasallia pustulata]|uniref:Carboxy-cis n=1 Tax=Lasallia pustulata TaxID=136370 RepID=A0A5M8PGS2_9LECA|nr:MAG: carboxy-cis [Lasallia pustulata]